MRVLVPVNIRRGETVSVGLMTLLSTLSTTVLGYLELPDQTDLDLARSNFGDRATASLEDIVQEFQQVGVNADHTLVFTHDRRKTVRRVATETGAEAIAKTGPTGDVNRILVSLTGEVTVGRILSFVEALIGGRDIGVTLFQANEESEAASAGLDEAAAQLGNIGIEVRTQQTARSPPGAMIDAYSDHDLIVIGEQSPSFRAVLFGDEAERLASKFFGPVISVRQGSIIEHNLS